MTMHEIQLMLYHHPFVGLNYLIDDNIILADTDERIRWVFGSRLDYLNNTFQSITGAQTITGKHVDIIDDSTQLKVVFNGCAISDIAELEKLWIETITPYYEQQEETEFEELTL